MSCAIEPTPIGWKVWRGPVPPALVQLAIDARDHIGRYPYGSFASQVDYAGQTVGIYKSHHVWTHDKSGQLVTGICIPGISLLVPANAPKGSPGVAGLGATPAGPNVDSLLTPDPDAALFGADVGPNWPLVAESGFVAAAVVGLFWAALHYGGHAAR